MALLDKIRELFPALGALLDPASLRAFISQDAEDLCLYPIGLGTWIRNTYLQPDNGLYLLFIEAGFCREDTMSSRILQLWHIHLRERARER